LPLTEMALFPERKKPYRMEKSAFIFMSFRLKHIPATRRGHTPWVVIEPRTWE
jgi:hypothetical protein